MSDKKPVELSPEELDNVAGGAPEFFIYDGQLIGRDDVNALLEETRKKNGEDSTLELLDSLLNSYEHRAEARDAYVKYGANMWNYLTSRGL